MKIHIVLSMIVCTLLFSSDLFATQVQKPVNTLAYMTCGEKAAKASHAWQDAGDCYQKNGIEDEIIQTLIAAHKGCRAQPAVWDQKISTLYTNVMMKKCGMVKNRFILKIGMGKQL